VNWINLAKDGVPWRTLMNTVMKLRVPLKAWNFLLTEQLLTSEERLCFKELVS